MYNTTEAVKAALGQSVVRMRLLSESVSLLAPDSKPVLSSDGKPIWVFAVGPFPDGRIEGEQLTSLSYSAGCCDGDIGIGSVSAASLSGTIHGVLNLLGVTFTAQVGVDVDGVTQWLNLGTFTVTECNRTDDSTTFTAYDAAYTALSAVYTPTVQSGATARAVLADVANQAVVEVEPSTLNLCTMTVTGDLTGHTCREMVGYIAALCGKNALITRDGFLRFVFVNPTEQTVTADDYYSGAMSNGGISKLWGLSCTVPGQEEEQTLTVGDAEKAVKVSCPYMTQAQLERVWYDIGGYEYPVGNVSFYRGLLTEPGDVVSLTNLAGVTISFPAMQVNLEIDGGCRCTISSFGKSEAVRISGTAGPTEKRLQSVQLTASRAMTSANGKNKVFHRATAPAASEGLTVGDIWFNTSLENQVSKWTGTAWSTALLGNDAIANLDVGKLTSGTISTENLEVITDYYSFRVVSDIDEDDQVTYGLDMFTGNDPEDIFAARLSILGMDARLGAGHDLTLSSSRGTVTIAAGGTKLTLSGHGGGIEVNRGVSGLFGSMNDDKTIAVIRHAASCNIGSNNAGNNFNSPIDVSETGYTPVGIVGWQFLDEHSSLITPFRIYLDNNSCYWYARNNSTAAYAGSINVDVLYVKN